MIWPIDSFHPDRLRNTVRFSFIGGFLNRRSAKMDWIARLLALYIKLVSRNGPITKNVTVFRPLINTLQGYFEWQSGTQAGAFPFRSYTK
jgi:hypothetical protein